MKNIIILSVFAFTLCNGLFLRQLSTVTVTDATGITACMANPYSGSNPTQKFSITNAVEMTTAQEYMKIVQGQTSIASDCSIASDEATEMTCTFKDEITAGTYKFQAAQTDITGSQNKLLAYESAEFTLLAANTPIIKAKATQANVTVDYSETEGPYNVTVAFESTLTAASLPEITANNKKLNCTLKADSTTDMICQWGSKTDLPVPEDKDKETYVVSFKNSCNKAEELVLGITVEDSQSIITLSKIALFVVVTLLL
jgi:hypothetical protein